MSRSVNLKQRSRRSNLSRASCRRCVSTDCGFLRLPVLPCRFPVRHLSDPELLGQDGDGPVPRQDRPQLPAGAGRLRLRQGKQAEFRSLPLFPSKLPQSQLHREQNFRESCVRLSCRGALGIRRLRTDGGTGSLGELRGAAESQDGQGDGRLSGLEILPSDGSQAKSPVDGQ